jgi:hypothetical protein
MSAFGHLGTLHSYSKIAVVKKFYSMEFRPNSLSNEFRYFILTVLKKVKNGCNIGKITAVKTLNKRVK